MKPIASVIVFLILVTASAVTSVHGYNVAYRAVVTDLDQALTETLRTKSDAWITPDTIRTYRNHLSLPQLKDRASIAYCLGNDRREGIAGSRICWNKGGKDVSYRGYANCSMATILSISNQSSALFLLISSMIWGIFALIYHRRQRESYPLAGICYGGICYDHKQGSFYNNRHGIIHFTPMQKQLMQMFFDADAHNVSHQEICDKLWPKKPNATETLHTLIRRTKAVVEAQSTLRIEVDRGKSYTLVDHK